MCCLVGGTTKEKDYLDQSFRSEGEQQLLSGSQRSSLNLKPTLFVGIIFNISCLILLFGNVVDIMGTFS